MALALGAAVSCEGRCRQRIVSKSPLDNAETASAGSAVRPAISKPYSSHSKALIHPTSAEPVLSSSKIR